MTKKEVQWLIDFLRPVKLRQAEGYSISGAEKGVFVFKRISVLSQDITALLAKIHLDETLERLKKMPNVDKRTLHWGAQVAEALNRCGQMRYADFGGEVAFQESLRIVRDNRRILESLILESQLPGGKAPAGMHVK